MNLLDPVFSAIFFFNLMIRSVQISMPSFRGFQDILYICPSVALPHIIRLIRPHGEIEGGQHQRTKTGHIHALFYFHEAASPDTYPNTFTHFQCW